MTRSKTLPTILGSRVFLRALTEQDVPALFAIFSDPEVMRYWSHPPFTYEAEAVAYLAEARQSFENKTLFQWGLCLRHDSSLVGTCTLWQLDASNRRAEIGFALAREHWRCGFMTEGLSALFDYCFDELLLHRLEADVDPENAASIALLERLGFQREGHLRERWLVSGKPCDSLFYGLLDRDWRERSEGTDDSL